jgi:hypothetical protein
LAAARAASALFTGAEAAGAGQRQPVLDICTRDRYGARKQFQGGIYITERE